MKISDLARQLNLPPAKLRQEIAKLDIELGKKSRTIKDAVAKDIIEKLSPKLEAEQQAAESKAQMESETDLANEKQDLENVIQLSETVVVRDFASKMKLPVTEVIKILMKNGIMANMNESIDFETASIIASDFNFKVKPQVQESIKDRLARDVNRENLQPRPPVVVIMGHVDHGKTTLLDKIRSTEVAAKESGGITQHIGAYQLEIKVGKEIKKRVITFLDTPGHKAFVAMREHGAKITDLAVLVVAANDGVKPQTIEAVDHAKAAGVPIIVAINKIDDPGADIDKTKRELADIGLASEEWGGSTVMVPISAKNGEGVDELIEMIFLEVDLQDLKADPTGLARGVVIESHLDPKIGPVATILIQKGKLHIGDVIWVGQNHGRVKIMTDEYNQKKREALPSDPVRVMGLAGVPNFGDFVEEVNSEKEARTKLAEQERAKAESNSAGSLAEASKSIRAGSTQELKIILKADVAGSLEAIKNSLTGLGDKDLRISIIHQGVGNITDSDIMTAKALGAQVIGFRVAATAIAKDLAKQEKITIQYYDVIYKLIDEVYAALSGLIEPEIVEVEAGRGKVLKIFTHGKKKKILGVKMTKGEVSKGNRTEIKRDGQVIGESEVTSVQKGTDTVVISKEGEECGIAISGKFEMLEDDQLIFYKKEERTRRLEEREQ